MTWLIIYGIGAIVTFIALTITTLRYNKLVNSMFMFDMCYVSLPKVLFSSIIWPLLVIFALIIIISELISGGKE